MPETSVSVKTVINSNSGFELDAGVSATQVVRQLRRSWARRIAWRTFWLVGVPTMLATIYYSLWASNQYESVSIITLQWAEQTGLSHSDSLLGTATAPANNARQLLSIRDYILSHSMFDEVDKQEHLTEHYKSRNWDIFSRLSSQSTREQSYRYFLGKIVAEFDSSSGSLTVRVRAFEPKMAQRISESILVSSERLLELQSDGSHNEILQNAERLFSGARERLVRARRQAAQLQPTEASGGGMNESKLRADLELEYAEKSFQSSITMIGDLQAVEIRRPQHLVTLAKPSLPDYSTYPRRLASVLTVLTFSFLIMGIGTMTWAAIREHARV